MPRPEPDSSSFTPPPIGQPRLFISRGTRDNVLPIDPCSRRIVPRLRGAGYGTTCREFDGTHSTPDAVAVEALKWWLGER